MQFNYINCGTVKKKPQTYILSLNPMETNLQMLYKQGVDMNLNHTYSIKI